MRPRFMRSVSFTGNLVRNAETGGAGGGAPASPPPPPPAAAPGTAAPGVTTPPPAGSTVLPAAARLGGAAPAAGAPAAPGTPTAAWYMDLPPELHPTIQAKGWGSAKDAIESYVSLEKVFGADRAGNTVVKPRQDATPEERSAFWSQLGAPAEAAGYDFKDVPGVGDLPADRVDAAKAWMHKAGVPSELASGLMAQVAAHEKSQGEAWIRESERAWNEVMLGYGAEADNNIELATRAAKQYGLSTETLDAMMRAGGPGAAGIGILSKMLVDLGKMSMEAPSPESGGVLPAGSSASAFAPSAEQAKAKIAALHADPAFVARHHSPNPKIREGAIAELERWNRIAYPG